MTPTNGILLQATGNAIYGRLVFNLALSIKANDPNAHITLIHDDTAIAELRDFHRVYIDNYVRIDDNDLEQDGMKHHFKLKTMLYKYSPYQNTMFIDADSLWLPNRKVSWLFGELAGLKFTSTNNGYYDFVKKSASIKSAYLFWGNVNTIKEYFKLGDRLPQLNTSFFYFSKCKETQELFHIAQGIYEDREIPTDHKDWGIADEFCFNVACAKTGLEPHEYPYNPIWIHFLKGMQDKRTVFANHWMLAIAGNKVNQMVSKMYNEQLNEYCTMLNIPTRFYHTDKAEVIPERVNM